MTAQNITNNLILASKARLADNNLIPRLGLGVKRRLECWKTIEEAKDQGLIRSIGVSNYGESYIKELLDFSFKHKPVANQCDLHSFMARSDLVEYCLSQDITLECWAPLVRAERFDHSVIVELAKKHFVTPAQLVMKARAIAIFRSALHPAKLTIHPFSVLRVPSRFSLQRGYISIPKSVSEQGIIENAHVFGFELDEQDVEQLDRLDVYLVTE
ncbi:related to 2,5-diketo-D-gluconic acid reductase [Melanopsichium pennsylvanicum]|uniref:Related to 2,5-diketo-D-gluconic acid reductase n=1 Tax=Melanopsichium pennsylvanicum TaxID=63383 RepID=A0AAJ5C5J2_9BASI|nr:related to 2,5-diketo-D-gluconic acid reductase [Melanopsichium pennsylvanicum]